MSNRVDHVEQSPRGGLVATARVQDDVVQPGPDRDETAIAEVVDSGEQRLGLVPFAQLDQRRGQIRRKMHPEAWGKPGVGESLQAATPDRRCLQETSRVMEMGYRVRLEARHVGQRHSSVGFGEQRHHLVRGLFGMPEHLEVVGVRVKHVEAIEDRGVARTGAPFPP